MDQATLQFMGAAGTVTGSRYLLTLDGSKLLVDCGLFQGGKPLRLRNWEPLPFDPASVQAVVLTHAHIDHTGALPLLVRGGFKGPIYATPGTMDLCRILLPDSARLQEEEAEHANRHGWSKHKPALPLYTEADALAALERFVPVGFDEEFEPIPSVRARFVPAGHILGSAMVVAGFRRRRICFTGDLGRPHDMIMRPPAEMPEVDYLVTESTYGNRVHATGDQHAEFGQIIAKTAARGGVVLVPAFAVGRTQSLLYCIYRLKQEGKIPAQLPVFLNSPMAINVTGIYHKYRAEHRLTDAQCEGMCSAAKYVNTVEESKRLNLLNGPMVILAGSGMATGGRIVHHLKAFAPDPRNTIVFAGFQAAATRGASLLAGAKTIRIYGEDIPVRAEVAEVSNLSAHADQREIFEWLSRAKKAPKRVFITHGEPAASAALQEEIEDGLRWTSHVPSYLESTVLAPDSSGGALVAAPETTNAVSAPKGDARGTKAAAN